MQRRYITVDVFTDRAFGGNPLAVVLDAGGLSTAQMQAIASEFNYSETTFVLPPRDAAHDAQVRIFTVNREIPFAGHPNVGTAFVLATQAAKPPARLKFEEKAGLGAGRNPEGAGQGGRRRTHRAAATQQADAIERRAGGEPVSRCRPRTSKPTGIRRRSSRSGCRFWWWRCLARRVAAGQARRRRVCPSVSVRRLRCGLFLYARCAAAEACDLQARMFHPGSSGLSEDPATGSATVAAAALLADLASERDGELKLRIGQGVDMGRPSLLLTRVRKAERRCRVSAHVGGLCVQMMEGTFRLVGEG